MATLKTDMNRNEKNMIARIKFMCEKAELKCVRDQILNVGYSVQHKVHVSLITSKARTYARIKANDKEFSINILLSTEGEVTGKVVIQGLEGFEPLDLWRAPDFNCGVDHLPVLFW